MNNLRHRIEKYLAKAMLLQVATAENNVPWVCTVCFAHDKHLNLYWFSRHATQHSKEIARNPRVAGAVVTPYFLGQKSKGLQFKGNAHELRSATDVVLGLAALAKRYKTPKERARTIARQLHGGSADYGLYRLRPDSIVLYDMLYSPASPRQVYVVPGRKRTVRPHARARL